MQVNSVSSVMAGKTSFGTNNDPGDWIETVNPRVLQVGFANMDDRTIREAAYLKASHDVNDKKHKRITNALYASIPVAAGLAAAVRTPNISKYTRALRLQNFIGTTLNWAGTFLAIDLIFGAKRKLENSNPKMKEFSQNNPILSTLGAVGMSLAAIWGLGKGSTKLISKIASKAKPKDIKAADKLYEKFVTKLNKNKTLNNISKQLEKVPSGIKNFAKGVLDYSPLLLIVSSIAHSFGHEKVKAQEYANNYRDLKTAQAVVRAKLAGEPDVSSVEV